MVRSIRVTYRRRHSYNTTSNKVQRIKTPGHRLLVHYTTKKATGPRCGDCGCSLSGIPHLRPKQYRLLNKRHRTVSRAYGGNKCAKCVKNRILRAFLIEEQKIVKRVLRSKAVPKVAKK